MRQCNWRVGDGIRFTLWSRFNSRSAVDMETNERFSYRPRWRYAFPFRTKRLEDFVFSGEETVVSVAYTYRNDDKNITVTLIPLRHFAHPQFFRQVDDLCNQHQSVLMEGRTPLTGAPYSTFVPPRDTAHSLRPVEHEDDEAWEPREIERFWQPFSWGVKESPNYTVIHAADKYDYEKLPLWCSLRFNIPLFGSLGREKHCLDMVYPLAANGYKSFAIPWGAAHMPVFNEMLLDNGFEQVGMCSLVIFNRIDGDISAGEHEKICRIQKRRRQVVQMAWLLVAFLTLLLMRDTVTIEYK
ncbi:hypothetical protein LSM04_005217 [Trypanosoma melophagium]|uniref:uncharacterized protein n=1 Tax=Trypanosoma melophagium TaxID=715481 RepID=UPI00351A0C3C|nr:hypothetical protein LSM04_005217 [Trypanosoma melophagium]